MLPRLQLFLDVGTTGDADEAVFAKRRGGPSAGIADMSCQHISDRDYSTPWQRGLIVQTSAARTVATARPWRYEPAVRP
jgi:hypothetical protein